MADYNYLDKGNGDGTIFGQKTTSKVAFWGVTPCDQAAALSTAATLITCSAMISATLDFVIETMASGSAKWGFVALNEAMTVMNVIANAQARTNEIEAALVAAGIIAGGTSAPSTTQYDYIGHGTDDGSILGQDSSEKVGFWGILPVDQPAAVTSALTTISATLTASVCSAVYTITVLASTSTHYGFIGEEEAGTFLMVIENIQARIASLNTKLVEIGIIAGGTDKTSSVDYDYLDKGNDDGTIMGVSTSAKLAFWGLTPIDQPAALTTALTTITVSVAAAQDTAIATFVQTSGYKFVSQDQGQTILLVVQNIQTRLGEITTALTSCGITA
jgi:hypothetical protein